jgi:hypothetical protein
VRDKVRWSCPYHMPIWQVGRYVGTDQITMAIQKPLNFNDRRIDIAHCASCERFVLGGASLRLSTNHGDFVLHTYRV